MSIFKKNKKLPEKQPEHKHKWVLIAKTHTEPVKPEEFSLKDGLTDTVLKMIVGITTLFYECECGEHKKEVLYGKDSSDVIDRWDEISEKVFRGGPQVIEGYKGTKFLIGKYTPNNEGNIPVR